MNRTHTYESFKVSNSSIVGVFGWMFYGLLLTALSAVGLFLLAGYGVISADLYLTITLVSSVVYLIYSFVAVFFMGMARKKTTSVVIYSIYALLLGLVLSSILVMFDLGTITYAFGGTCLIFGIMALYGYFTKRDLTSMASMLSMLLIGAILVSLINSLCLFLLGPAVYTTINWVISYVILAVVIGYVAFDIQRIKNAAENGALVSSIPIYLAFMLYTDFVAIFVRLVQIIAASRDN